MSASVRRTSVTAWIGDVPVGGAHPIVVQSMTNTDTSDVEGRCARSRRWPGRQRDRAHHRQRRGGRAGGPEIRARLDDAGHDAAGGRLPLQRPHRLLREYPRAAAALAKYRINPGNVGAGRHHDTNFATMIEVAKEHAGRCGSA
jgi:(E)-4-hydroxy-3-methylbut-2-enyl-diphosphate synthase